MNAGSSSRPANRTCRFARPPPKGSCSCGPDFRRDCTTPTVPASAAAPVALVRSAVFPCTSTRYRLAVAKVRLPLTVSVPTELPGDSAPPGRMVVGPTVPLPPSVPPKLTNTGEDAIEPFTLSVPALTKSARYKCSPP